MDAFPTLELLMHMNTMHRLWHSVTCFKILYVVVYLTVTLYTMQENNNVSKYMYMYIYNVQYGSSGIRLFTPLLSSRYLRRLSGWGRGLTVGGGGAANWKGCCWKEIQLVWSTPSFCFCVEQLQSWNTHTHGHSQLYAVVLVRSRHNYVNVRRH